MWGHKARRLREQAERIADLADRLEDALDQRDRAQNITRRTTGLFHQLTTEEATDMPNVSITRLNSLRRGAQQAAGLKQKLDRSDAEQARLAEENRALRKRVMQLHDHCAAIEQRLAYLTTCNQAMEFELAVERGLPINPNAVVAALPTAGCEK